MKPCNLVCLTWDFGNRSEQFTQAEAEQIAEMIKSIQSVIVIKHLNWRKHYRRLQILVRDEQTIAAKDRMRKIGEVTKKDYLLQ